MKSQWDFGELFPPETLRRVFSVSELTGSIRRLLEKEIGSVWVSGEISNLRAQSSGHVYFSIKDAGAQLCCVLFRSEGKEISRDLLQDGKKVIVQGELTVYEVRGQYQLRVTAVEWQGLGALQAAFERLKQKLQAEGLFAAERKRALPRFPQRIGIVTSPTGAALRDVLHVVRRRHAGLQIVLAPCRVQGTGAAAEIAEAIRLLNDWAVSRAPALPGPSASLFHGLDLILVTRGGGSLEDLWAFNEEVVARAIGQSEIPIVSAVGHEIDFTISDFVADFRAATPSAAAEIITEGMFSSRNFVESAGEQLVDVLRGRVEGLAEEWQRQADRLARAHPRRRMLEKSQRVDDLECSLLRYAKVAVRHGQEKGRTIFERLMRVRPGVVLEQRRERLRQSQEQFSRCARQALEDLRTRADRAVANLRLLSPQNVLNRGYSITMDAASGKVVRNSSEVQAGQRLKTRLQNGEISSVAEG